MDNKKDGRFCAAILSELPEIIEIYNSARLFMAEQGNPDQWNGGYPSRHLLKQDIAEKQLFLYKSGDKILAVFRFTLGDDPTYRVIYDGSWLNELPYGVIHRIAVAEHGRGVGRACIEWCLDRCHNIRIDTSSENRPMQRLLRSMGFAECGTIYIETGEPRIAFQITDFGVNNENTGI